jgi:gamma-glutamyltranspeptidase
MRSQVVMCATALLWTQRRETGAPCVAVARITSVTGGTDHAVEAGLRYKGGNAVDAGVAATLALRSPVLPLRFGGARF